MRRAASTLVFGASLFAAVAVFLPTAARAGDIEDFEIARAAYEARDFPRAVFYFEQLVGGDQPRLSSPALVAEARKYLGAAFVFVGRREAAREQFERLLRDEPSYVLDPLLFPVEVQELFTAVRERLELERREAEARAAVEDRAARELERSRLLLRFAEEEVRVEMESSRWLALIPGGVGQFQNGDDALGWTFLVSEVALAGVAIGALAWHQSLSVQVARAQALGNPDAVAEGNSLLEIAFALHWSALGALTVLALSGILEAQIRFVPTRVVTQQRRVPDELREGLEDEVPSDAPPPTLSVGAGLGGASLSLRF